MHAGVDRNGNEQRKLKAAARAAAASDRKRLGSWEEERKPHTHQASAQTEDCGEVCLGVDVSSEKAVAHIARVLGIVVVGVGGVVGLRAQVLHGVGGGDEAGVGGQVEVEAFPECIDPVVGL